MGKRRKYLGQTTDVSLRWVVEINPEMEEWRSLAEAYLKTATRNKDFVLKALTKFLNNYIINCNMSRVPSEFLQRNYQVKSFYHCCLLGKVNNKNWVTNYLKCLYAFLNWVLENHFSAEDDNGNSIISSEFHNPFTPELPEDAVVKATLDESDKNTLPYRFIKQLRIMLCPIDATTFKDWIWAQEAMDTRKDGDWFVVDQALIAPDDPDCVWRQRATTKYEQKTKKLPKTVCELWSPARSVALYFKLLLPLRTYQVRMLDSGEADTYRYEQLDRAKTGTWTLNSGNLRQGSEKYPFMRGVFRRFIAPSNQLEMTGFFINTNKTADIGKEEWDKGYEVPWQYEEALFWLAKLRNWQEKYNPIHQPTPFTALTRNHFGAIKDRSILKQMGTACFLFRNAAENEINKCKPLRGQGLEPLWYKLLLKLEDNCNHQNNDVNHVELKFVKNGLTTFYPLHSLRVSLITAYALEGGLPMPVLSKCIAGHSHLVMTLYYTKAGISYVSEKMNEAEKRMAEQDQESYHRWLMDATLQQLEVNTAVNDPIALQAVINAQQSCASFIKDDKGICPKGALGCTTGGRYTNDDFNTVSYGNVPGYPQQNCVQCRWFLTGPAFLPGLIHHFNVLSYEMGEVSKRLAKLNGQVEELESQKLKCEEQKRPFFEETKLIKMHKFCEGAEQEADKIANDMNATVRLIAKCKTLLEEAPKNHDIQLVTVGTMEDLKIQFEDIPDKLYQIQTVCNGATIFPETDVSKAVLQRSQALDLAFMMNGHKPILLTLSPDEQLAVSNAWMQLLIARTSSLKEALPYAEGIKKLEEIGLEDVSLQMKKLISKMPSFKLLDGQKN